MKRVGRLRRQWMNGTNNLSPRDLRFEETPTEQAEKYKFRKQWPTNWIDTYVYILNPSILYDLTLITADELT